MRGPVCWSSWQRPIAPAIVAERDAGVEENREALAGRDPANSQWQTDVAVSCAKLGTLEHGQSAEIRREFLLRGRGILAKLKEEGRLLPSQGWIGWFDRQLEQLPGGGMLPALEEVCGRR